MRVHHLNGATLCPIGGVALIGNGAACSGARLVCHCLAIETNEGLVLVDTGLGLDDVHAASRRGVRRVLGMLGARLREEETLVHQLGRLGYRATDVRHIVLTHLDLDHAGGLADFPQARVHVMAAEHDAAVMNRRLSDRTRYHEVQWAHGPLWELYEARGERWRGFDCVSGLKGLPPEILLVPMAGHSRGHAAVAVDTGDGWLLHAGDAYFFRGEVDPSGPSCPPGLRWAQAVFEVNRIRRLENQRRLRELVASSGRDLRVFCSHDPHEWESLSQPAAEVEITPSSVRSA